MNRRAFLQMLGVASVAVALPPILARADSPAIATVDRGPLTASFIEPDLTPVGPSFVIPADWWDISGGVARLRNELQCLSWPGPSCRIGGLAFFRDGQRMFYDQINFGHQGPEYVSPGSVVLVQAIALRMDGLPVAAAEAMFRAVLL